ncbi:MAG: cytochrome c maturation protein CcmE [Coriobacteriaceae bacterium]|nr:cytochrome c maturation protein CcmE [Coriobacteriaceae bacterium]
MNSRTKKRLIIVSGTIVVVLIVLLALFNGTSTAKVISIADAASGNYINQKVQVTGNVVNNSFETTGTALVFDLYDPDSNAPATIRVRYDGGVSATFGNDVVAICTGKIGEDGVLKASEMVTKCPSKYENATDALSVSQLLSYDSGVYDKPVKLAGTIKPGSLKAIGQGDRFILVDADGSTELPIEYEGALPDEAKEGTELVVTGSLGKDKSFVATAVAIGR